VTATISLVAGSQPEGIIAAAARLTAPIAAVEVQVAAQRAASAQWTSGWRVDAATAALLRAEKDLQRLPQLEAGLQGIQSALNSLGAHLSSLRTHILSTGAQATALGGVVSADGSVRPAGFGDLMTPAMAAAYTALLKKLLETFDVVDEATASALTTAAAPHAPPHPAMPQNPEQGTDPQQLKQWWDVLSPEERQRLADEQPERIGNLNGIPVATRDYSNRRLPPMRRCRRTHWRSR
jgi:hypothetical protein